MQLKRFCNELGIIGKDCTQIECFPKKLVVPVGREEESVNSLSYELVAMINHQGSLSAGHYWAYVKDESVNKWYNYNDRAANLLLDFKKRLNNTFSYILFYRKV